MMMNNSLNIDFAWDFVGILFIPTSSSKNPIRKLSNTQLNNKGRVWSL